MTTNEDELSARGCPFHVSSAVSPAFSVIDVLGGLIRLDRRPENLRGSILSRAMTCRPFVEGNKTGVFLSLTQPAMLSRDPDQPALQMTDEVFEKLDSGYKLGLKTLFSRGLLEENGYWHDRLKEGCIVRRGDTVDVWTGLLVRPASGLWLLATGSYNRRAQVELRDAVIASSEGYTPLILQFDLATMWKDTMWLETELACLVPLQPGVSFERKTLREVPEIGQAHSDFYTAAYLESRAEGKPVGHYRKFTMNAPAPPAGTGIANCSLIHIAGPDVHTIETFPTVLGPQGILPEETAAALPYVMLRNCAPLAFDFDGIMTHLEDPDADLHGADLTATWQELYGTDSPRFLPFWANYFNSIDELHLGEPHCLLLPYAFIKTPPGWSTLADGSHYPGLDGLRGVIATDLFYHAGPVYHFRRPGDFRIETGEPLMRLLPIPRNLLDAPWQTVTIDGEQEAMLA